MSVLLLFFLLAGETEGGGRRGGLWTLWVALAGAHLLAETSLNTVSNNYFYQHHQVTVWLWAIFPPSMWQGCNGTSVLHLRHCNILSWSLKSLHVFSRSQTPPPTPLPPPFPMSPDSFPHGGKDCLWFNWAVVEVKVKHTPWLWLTSMNT